MTKRAFVDLETTGLGAESGVHQIAIMIELDGGIVAERSWNVRPHRGDVVTPKALEVAGVTDETLKSYSEPLIVHTELTDWLSKWVDPYNKTDKLTWLGYNAYFDYSFLRRWWKKCGDKWFGSWFWNPPVDIMGLVMLRCEEQRAEFANFKQWTVAKKLGIDDADMAQLHDALYDVRLCYRIFQVIKPTTVFKL